MSPSAVLGRSVGALRTAGPPISRLARAVRGRHLLAFDLIGVTFAAYMAVALRYDGFGVPGIIPAYLPFVGLLLLVRTLADIRLGLYDRTWRFASIPDLERIVAAVSLGDDRDPGHPRGLGLRRRALAGGRPQHVLAAEMMLSLAIIGGIRFAIRAASDLRPDTTAAPAHDSHRTLLYGAGRTGALIARSAAREPGAGVVPVGFLDDDPHRSGASWPACACSAASPSSTRRRGDRCRDRCSSRCPARPAPPSAGSSRRPRRSACEVRTVPAMTDLLDGSVDAYRVRRVQVEDLLRRPIVTEHAAAVGRDHRGPDVLITGAGRLDRLRARPAGLRARPPPAHPRRPRREPAVPAPARARGRSRARPGAAASCATASPTSPAVPRWTRLISHRAPERHLPRRRLQARADDGGAPVRRVSRSTSAGRASCSTRPSPRASSGSSSSRPTRPSGRRASWARASASPRCSSPRPPGGPAGRYVSVRFGNVLGLDRQRRADLPGAARERRARSRSPTRT